MITIKVDYDVAHEIVKNDIKDCLETLSSDFGKVVVSGKGIVFCTDANEDAKQIKKLIKAMVRVHNWYEHSSKHLKIDDYV